MPVEKISEPTMSDRGFDIMRYAVRLARDEQIQRLASLRNRLNAKFPGESADIEAALKNWADYCLKNSSFNN